MSTKAPRGTLSFASSYPASFFFFKFSIVRTQLYYTVGQRLENTLLLWPSYQNDCIALNMRELVSWTSQLAPAPSRTRTQKDMVNIFFFLQKRSKTLLVDPILQLGSQGLQELRGNRLTTQTFGKRNSHKEGECGLNGPLSISSTAHCFCEQHSSLQS